MIKWKKEDVIKAFQEAMQQKRNPLEMTPDKKAQMERLRQSLYGNR